MAHLKIMATAATVWAPGSPCIVGSSCRKRRTIVKLPLPRGQGRAARPPFGDPRAPSTVPRRSWWSPQNVNLGGPSPNVFWYTFWFIFGLPFWCPPEHRHYVRSVRRVVFFEVLWRTGCGLFGNRKRVTVVKFTAPRLLKQVPKREVWRKVFSGSLVISRYFGTPSKSTSFGTFFGHDSGVIFWTRAGTQFGCLLAPGERRANPGPENMVFRQGETVIC